MSSFDGPTPASWPMSPGTRWVYRDIRGEGADRHVVITVSRRKMRDAGRLEAVIHDGETVDLGKLASEPAAVEALDVGQEVVDHRVARGDGLDLEQAS
jgi:hypothetical protein